MHSLIILMSIVVISYTGDCSKILVVSPSRIKSHYILSNTLAKALAETGHEVTIISAYDTDVLESKNYKNISLSNFEEWSDELTTGIFALTKMTFQMKLFLNLMGKAHTSKVFNNLQFQKFLQSKEHFDLVIVEQFANDNLKILGYHFEVPVIVLCTTGPWEWSNKPVSNPSPPSYIPDLLLEYTSSMDFWQRLMNLLMRIWSDLIYYFVYLPTQTEILMQHVPNAPQVGALVKNSSLVLLNSHESVTQAVPIVPNIIQIGGFHIKPPKELPRDLRNFLDSSKYGIVYFSLGSNIQAKHLTKEIKCGILRALGKLKQRVLMKWSNDEPGDSLPKNVKALKWIPQQDLLAHPNIKLFITHAGLLSILEAIYHGVPVLTLPLFGDQRGNGARAEQNGYGINIPLIDVTEEKLTQALNKILTNNSYKQNAVLRSTLFHDRPIKPLDLAIYWIEFVIRHKGAPHLKVAGADLPWYQYYLLDVFAFLIIFILLFVLALCFVLKKILLLYSCKNKEKYN